MTKILALLFVLVMAVGLGVLTMMYGWGLQPQSWGWIIGGGIFGQLFLRLVLDKIGDE